jgi:hypothetical protein
MFFIVSGMVILLGWTYVFFIRPYLVAHYPLYGKFAEFESAFYLKSRTILMARLYWVGGIVVALQQLAASAGLDVTPLVQEMAKWIPDGYRSLAVAFVMFATGLIFEALRRKTIAPVDKEPTE